MLFNKLCGVPWVYFVQAWIQKLHALAGFAWPITPWQPVWLGTKSGVSLCFRQSGMEKLGMAGYTISAGVIAAFEES